MTSNVASSQTSAPDGFSVTKRLSSELMSLMMSAIPGISAFPDSDNMLSWVGTLTGVAGTYYEGLTFKLSMKFPSNYPYSAPTIKFDTPCYHPNVDMGSGAICLDILKEQWSAVYNVQTILLSLQSLLGEPNNDSPLNPEAAQLWDCTEEFKAKLAQTYQVPEDKE
ncbi:Ubiquitin-conjugating enzyme E2 11 [Basidiobolus ranarum]|uniref:Ubiquitin-conjugating enzyme E2 11 n=1 Tax=Basidiobolus ranarum TaxID=34480 RepID=A0ABR2X0X8_9FUNG